MAFEDVNISKALFDFIRKTLFNGTILELGSGEGTVELLAHYRVHSIEHDSLWVGKFHNDYIYAPLCWHKPIKNHEGDEWYSAEILRRELPKIKYDLLLIDGPPKYRAGLIKYHDLFNPNVPWVFDDMNRRRDFQVIHSISNRLARPYTIYNSWGEGKPFGVIMP